MSKLLLAVLALAATACSTAQLGLMQRGPKGPDQDVVESLACRGDFEEAARYVELRGGSLAERIERVEAAKKATAGKPGCCPAGGCKAGQQ